MSDDSLSRLQRLLVRSLRILNTNSGFCAVLRQRSHLILSRFQYMRVCPVKMWMRERIETRSLSVRVSFQSARSHCKYPARKLVNVQ